LGERRCGGRQDYPERDEDHRWCADTGAPVHGYTLLEDKNDTRQAWSPVDGDGQLLQVLGEVPDVAGSYILGGGMLFTLGPLYARLMAELMVSGSSSLPITAHDPVRFGRRVLTEPLPSLTL
jgi:hypothetical protein